MAKKTKRPVKRAASASKKAVKTAAPAKQSVPSSGGNYIMAIVISVVMVAAAVGASIVYSSMTKAKKAAEVPTPVPVNTVAPNQVPVNPANISIKDPKSGRVISVPVKPASSSVSQAPAQQPAAVNPAAVPTSTNIPQRCKVYFTEVASKEAIHRIDIEDAEYLYQKSNVVFIDARGKNEYDEAHIKGALSIPAGSSQDLVKSLANELKGKVLVTYCHGVGCHLSDKTAYLLYDAGYRKIAIFFGGWPKWQEHKLPIASKK